MSNNGFGRLVTFVDGAGEEHEAIVLEPLPDCDYVTLARPLDGVESIREEYVGTGWEIETSVYPHESTGASGETTETHAYRQGWPDDADETAADDGWGVTD